MGGGDSLAGSFVLAEASESLGAHEQRINHMATPTVVRGLRDDTLGEQQGLGVAAKGAEHNGAGQVAVIIGEPALLGWRGEPGGGGGEVALDDGEARVLGSHKGGEDGQAQADAHRLGGAQMRFNYARLATQGSNGGEAQLPIDRADQIDHRGA